MQYTMDPTKQVNPETIAAATGMTVHHARLMMRRLRVKQLPECWDWFGTLQGANAIPRFSVYCKPEPQKWYHVAKVLWQVMGKETIKSHDCLVSHCKCANPEHWRRVYRNEHQVGRPRKVTPDLVERVKHMPIEHGDRKQVARRLGICPSTLSIVRKQLAPA